MENSGISGLARNMASRWSLMLFVIGVATLHVREVCGDGSGRQLRPSHNKALKGDVGQKLRALTSRSIQSIAECPNEYDSSRTYASGDIVSLSGVAYRCKSGMAFRYCNMYPPNYSVRAAGDSSVVHETRDDLGWVRLVDCDDNAPRNNDKSLVGEDANQSSANYRQGSFAKRRSNKSKSQLRRHDKFRLKGNSVSKSTKQLERNYRTKGKGDSSKSQLQQPKGYRLKGSSTNIKTPQQAEKHGKDKGMRKGVKKGIIKRVKREIETETDNDPPYYDSKFIGDNRYSSSDKNEVTLGATDIVVKDRYKPNAGYSEMALQFAETTTMLIRFDLSRVDTEGVASLDVEATLQLYFLENCSGTPQFEAVEDNYWPGRKVKWYNAPYRAGPTSAQPRVTRDRPRRNEWYDVDVARALLWSINVKGQRYLTFRVSLESGDDYACIAASGGYRGGKYSPTLGIRLYREKGGRGGEVGRYAQKKQRMRPRVDEFIPGSKDRKYAPIQRDAVQDRPAWYPTWYVNYSLGGEGRCVQNCEESQGRNCGGVAGDWDELHSSPRECCEEKLWWLDQNKCASGAIVGRSSNAVQDRPSWYPTWYVDYSLGEGRCVQNCGKSQGRNCGGLASNGVELHSSPRECCEEKLWWLDRNQCAPGATVGRSAPRWYVDYSRGKGGQCVMDCDETNGRNCGGKARAWDELFSSPKACCEGKLWWMGAEQCSPGAS